MIIPTARLTTHERICALYRAVQGLWALRKQIILLEDGCAEFTHRGADSDPLSQRDIMLVAKIFRRVLSAMAPLWPPIIGQTGFANTTVARPIYPQRHVGSRQAAVTPLS